MSEVVLPNVLAARHITRQISANKLAPAVSELPSLSNALRTYGPGIQGCELPPLKYLACDCSDRIEASNEHLEP